MVKLHLRSVLMAAALAGTAAHAATTHEKYRSILQPLPASAQIPADNPQTAEKIELGRMLYWDRRVSKTGASSCGFCHHPT